MKRPRRIRRSPAAKNLCRQCGNHLDGGEFCSTLCRRTFGGSDRDKKKPWRPVRTGKLVLVLYLPNGQYYCARILSRTGNVYKVKYTVDDTVEGSVTRRRILTLPQKGEPVEARFCGRSTWYNGKVHKLYSNGAYDVEYAGFIVKGVDVRNVRKPKKKKRKINKHLVGAFALLFFAQQC